MRSLQLGSARKLGAVVIATQVLCAPAGARAEPRPYAARPPAAERVPAAEVRFEPDEPDLQLFGASGRYLYATWGWRHRVRGPVGWVWGYTPICDRPCLTRFGLGPHHLALSRDGGGPVSSDEPVVIEGPSRLHASYEDHSGLRAAGWVIGAAGIVGGVVLIASAGDRHETVCNFDGVCYRQTHVNDGLLFAGIGVIVASAIVGGVLASRPDKAHFRVEPLQLSALGAEADSLLAPRATQGAALSWSF